MSIWQPPIGAKEMQGTSLDAALLGSAGLVDHHTAAILPIAGANEFPWKEAAKEILVYICQKPPRFSLSKLPNIKPMLLLITMNYDPY